MFDFIQLKRNISSVNEELNKIRLAIGQKQTELNALDTAPLPYQEYIQMWDKFIDDQTMKGNRNIVTGLERYIDKPKNVPGFGDDFFMVPSLVASIPPGVIPLENFYTLFSGILKERMREIMPPEKYPKEVGLPLKDRAETAKKLTAEIEKLTAREDKLIVAINEIGAVL